LLRETVVVGRRDADRRHDCLIQFAATEDFRRLDGSLKEPVAKQLRKLETAPRLGEHLDNRAGLDLTGYYKLHAAKKSIRVVYRIVDQEILVEVVAIGKREDRVVYQEALKRLKHRDR
jgi:mRNA interferase RelE/StbE